MKLLSNLFIPLLVLIVVLYATFKKNNVYDNFVEGAKEALPMVLNMFPPLLAMIFAVNIFTNSKTASSNNLNAVFFNTHPSNLLHLLRFA